MPKVQPPELKNFMDKRLSRTGYHTSARSTVRAPGIIFRVCSDCSVIPAVSLNGNRHVTGVLRGFDQFMNVVLDNTIDDKSKTDIGMVVSLSLHLPAGILELHDCNSPPRASWTHGGFSPIGPDANITIHSCSISHPA